MRQKVFQTSSARRSPASTSGAEGLFHDGIGFQIVAIRCDIAFSHASVKYVVRRSVSGLD